MRCVVGAFWDARVSLREGHNARKMPLKVTIKKWHAVARWTWGDDVDGDVCTVCQNPFEGCPDGVMYPGDGAPVVWGKCKHAYHLQCISQWLSTKNSCPMCRREWEFESNSAQTAADHESRETAAAAAAAPAAATPDASPS